MKGVVLAGGLGTRLYPLTHVTNKHLLPVYNKPMVFYPIATLVNAGIAEILLVTSGPHVGHFLGVLKNGKELGVSHLEYAYQERPDGGIADALSLAEDFADGSPITVILGDNTTDVNIKEEVDNFKDGALIFLKRIENKEQLKKLGIAVFDKDNRLVRIEEKPEEPKSNFAQTGLYIYDSKVFDYIRMNKPSKRGELEITDVNNRYLEHGELHYEELKGFWSDAGSFETLFQANAYWREKEKSKA